MIGKTIVSRLARPSEAGEVGVLHVRRTWRNDIRLEANCRGIPCDRRTGGRARSSVRVRPPAVPFQSPFLLRRPRGLTKRGFLPPFLTAPSVPRPTLVMAAPPVRAAGFFLEYSKCFKWFDGERANHGPAAAAAIQLIRPPPLRCSTSYFF